MKMWVVPFVITENDMSQAQPGNQPQIVARTQEEKKPSRYCY